MELCVAKCFGLPYYGIKKGGDMIATHVHDALSQVRRLQALILARKNFQGYSGLARMASGTAVMGAAMVLNCDLVPRSVMAHLFGWGAVMGLAMMINYGALAYWYFTDPEAKTSPMSLFPAIDAVPALAAGGVLSATLVMWGHFNMLQGVWMLLFGVAHTGYRLSLPRANYFVGMFYMVCGTAYLAYGEEPFTNPWPMGLVFFFGEWMGGWIFWRSRVENGNEDGQYEGSPQ